MPPRPEYPRPQCRRSEWINLNGVWSFADDPDQSGAARGWTDATLPETITVPFCRESKLSGLARTDQMPCVWYSREISIPNAWSGQRILLHFGAADYETSVWIDGHPIGSAHRGGHSSFSVELTAYVRPGATHRLTVRCLDEARLPRPCGKQRSEAESTGCVYVQTTGMWQTVWLEPLPRTFLRRPRITPLVDGIEYFRQLRRALIRARRQVLVHIPKRARGSPPFRLLRYLKTICHPPQFAWILRLR